MLQILMYIFSNRARLSPPKQLVSSLILLQQFQISKYPLLIVSVFTVSLFVTINIKHVVCWWKQ